MNLLQRSASLLFLWVAGTTQPGCSAPGESTPTRGGTQAAPVAALAGSPSPQLSHAASDDMLSPTRTTPAAPTNTGDTRACQPGVYDGGYMAELFGSGPLRFDLVAATLEPPASTPCQEFCPELVLNSEGGELSLAWTIFEGIGKVRGGLDCRSGEFRGELVEGKTGFAPLDAGVALLLPSGTISGTFRGNFSSSPKPAIDGTFMTLADGLVEASGTFHVELQP